MAKIYNIIIDAMGGDFAPNNEVQGGLMAVAEGVSRDINLSVTFVGKQDEIKKIVTETNIVSPVVKSNNISIIDANEVITMHDDPVTSLKTKKDSSMIKGISLLKEGKGDGYISAGNTGASLTIATMLLGRIQGVTRPTIGVMLPTIVGKPVFLVDVGATIETKARFLFEYGVMGSIYHKAMTGTDNPSVGLLNIGSEDTKGTAEHLEAYKHLSNSSLNFYGNIEGSDILSGKTDIAVTDGFSGNLLLKHTEGFVAFISAAIKQLEPQKIAVAGPMFKEIMLGFDNERYGGVSLLGVNGTVIIGHGNSTPQAIKNMVFCAVADIQSGVRNLIAEALQTK